MARQNRVRQEHDFLIHRTFVVPRGTRDYRLIPELHRREELSPRETSLSP
jgi:hypothetical protein